MNNLLKTKTLYENTCIFLDRFCIFPLVVFYLLFIYNKDILPYQLNPDEGINLIKAHLLLNQYQFATDIWSDQPPLLSYFLKIVFRQFDENIYVARYFIYTINLVGIIVLYKLFRRYSNFFITNIAIVLLFSNNEFALYSPLILVGYPAITFGLISLYLLELKDKHQLCIFLSAIFFVISIFTKLFTIFYLAIIVTKLLQSKERLKLLSIFFITSSALSILIVWLFNLIENYKMLLDPHIKSILASDLTLINRFTFLSDKMTLILILYGTLSCLYLIVNNAKAFITPIGLFIVSLIFSLTCSPLFPHHIIFIVIPILFVSACATEVLQKLFIDHMKLSTISSQFILLAILIFMIKQYCLPKYQYLSIEKNTQAKYNQIISSIQKSGFIKNQLIISDLPIFNFLLKANSIPSISVITNKRLDTGNLSIEEIKKNIVCHSPSFVIAGRYSTLQNESFYKENFYEKILEIKDGLDYTKQPIFVYKKIS